MLFYSFLRLLTLQIGVAVLACLLVTLAIVLIIVNFIDIHLECAVPINYIVLGIFIVLVLIAGMMMFAAAYNENKSICTFSMVLMVIILLFYLIASIISFLNMPSMTKNVCTYRSHCPESLWLSGLNYRKNSGADDYVDYVTSEEPDTKGVTNITSETVTTHERGPDDEVSTASGFQVRLRNWRENKPYSPTTISHKTSKTEESSKIDLTVQFPIDSTALRNRFFEDYKNNNGFLRIVKRSVSLIESYFKEEPSPRIHKLIQQKYKRDGESDKNENESGSDEGYESKAETESVETENSDIGQETTESVPEEETRANGTSEYDFGYNFFVSVILFLLIILFFIYTILVLLSYRKQLKYIKLYSKDPASNHYMV